MGWLGSFFKKLWNALRKIIAVILVVIAVVIAVWACLITGGAALPLLFGLSTTMMYVVAGLCLVGAFIVDKKTAKKTVGKIADAVDDAAGAVGQVGGAALAGVAGALLGNPYVVAGALAFLAYILLKDDGYSTGDAKTRNVGTPSTNGQRTDDDDNVSVAGVEDDIGLIGLSYGVR